MHKALLDISHFQHKTFSSYCAPLMLCLFVSRSFSLAYHRYPVQNLVSPGWIAHILLTVSLYLSVYQPCLQLLFLCLHTYKNVLSLSQASLYFFISLRQTELYLLFYLFKAQQTLADLRSVNFPDFPEAGCLIGPSSSSAKHWTCSPIDPASREKVTSYYFFSSSEVILFSC